MQEARMKISILMFLLVVMNSVHAQQTHRNIKTIEYAELQQRLGQGWNTWYNQSVITHAYLPYGFSINLCLTHDGSDYLKDVFKSSKMANRKEEVLLGLRSDDGTYTSLKLKYKDAEIEVQTAAIGKDQYILVTPFKKTNEILAVEAGLLWNNKGLIGVQENTLLGKFGNETVVVNSTEDPIFNGYALSTSPRLFFKLNKELALYTGENKSLATIKSIICEARNIQEKRMKSYGSLSESFKAMQSILAWNTIYDASNKRVITPISRIWNMNYNGYILCEWDTYFASLMCSYFNKDLAYANAVEITKAITPEGFVPNLVSPFGLATWDRSQPPVGSTVILEIFRKYKEEWLLVEVYDELVSWNRWWPSHRDVNGFLAWGSDIPNDSLRCLGFNNMQAAKYESGLDNSPMYDDVPFNTKTHVMELADVGLMSLYIMDCNSMAEIATALGKKDDAAEFHDRAEKYKTKLNELWDEKTGIFLNKRLDTGEKSYRLTPTNFYPMLAKACTQDKAERMIDEHYFNANEFHGEFVIPSVARNDSAFKDMDYWRGRIWGPMNLLIYWGMRNYNFPEARADLAERSNTLLMKQWNVNGSICENYNCITGLGDDGGNTDAYYHWGALLSYIYLIERGNKK
jgi:hypothetical protein